MTITREGNMETKQMAPIFSCTFSTLTICNIHLKLPIHELHHTFLEFRHPEITKNPYHV